MSDETQELPAQFIDNVVDQAFTLWIEPELERRGEVPDRAAVWAALIELPPAGGSLVRLNDEVKVQLHSLSGSDIEPGTVLTEDNLDALDHVAPVDVGDDSGWVFFTIVGSQTLLASDFRYNKPKAAELLSLATDYRATAAAGYAIAPRPAVDNLFSAAELTVQAMMLGEVQLTKKHPQRAHWLKVDTGNGNQPRAHYDALRRLAWQRAAARYGDGELTVDGSEFGELAQTVADMIAHARERTGV